MASAPRGERTRRKDGHHGSLQPTDRRLEVGHAGVFGHLEFAGVDPVRRLQQLGQLERFWRLGGQPHRRLRLSRLLDVNTDTSRTPRLGVREVFWRFWPYTRGFRGWLASGIALGLVLPAIQAASIWMFKVLVDQVLVPRDLGAFWWVGGIYLAITVAAGVGRFANSYLSRWLAQHFALNLRVDLFSHLHALSLDVLDRHRVGDLLYRLTSDVAAVRRLVVSAVTRTLGNGVRVVLFAGLLFWLSWPLALVALAVTPMFALAARSFATRLKTAARTARFHSGAMSAVAEESLGNAPLVHAYQRQDSEVDRFDAEAQQRMHAKLRAARLSAAFGPLVSSVEVIGVLAVFGIGTMQMASGRLSLGGLLAFVGYLSQLLGPVRSLARLTNTVYSASAGAERISEVLTATSSVPEPPDAAALPPVSGGVEFDQVGFTYPGAGAPALQEVTLSVQPGDVLALTGPSGSGKTTIARLLLRMYDPTTGVVRVDGHDIVGVSLDSLRANIAVVLQQTHLFHGTVGDNIAFGRPGASVEEVRRAAQAAHAESFIKDLSDGYDTALGERGRSLSGGQRQRIAIARAVVRDAPVLVLDEPTSGLDDVTRDRVLVSLRRLMAGRTTILITHDPHVAALADTEVRIEHGRVVAPEPVRASA